MANTQIDLMPGTSGNTTGLHFHSPNGASACNVTNPTEAPSIPANSTAAKVVSVKIAQANGGPRFQNPS